MLSLQEAAERQLFFRLFHRTANGNRSDGERKPIGRRTESDRTADGIRSDGERNLIGRRTESDRTANGARRVVYNKKKHDLSPYKANRAILGSTDSTL